MSIEIGSKWVKDGEVVEVTNITETVGRDEVIYFKCKQGKDHVLYDYDFLEQYKPYEVGYEFQWAYKISIPEWWNITRYFTDEEFEQISKNPETEYQRLDFTKRERK